MAPPRRTLRTPRQLAAAGLATGTTLEALEAVAARFAVAITPAVSDAIDPADPQDPLARQFVPSPAELTVQPAERADPIGDQPFTPVPGITHRYPDRVLFKPILSCPVYCRFCFRREVVGGQGGLLSPAEVDAALAYIEAHDEVWEVILTGGDPLILSPARLGALLRRLAAIPHVEVLRLHTRVPVVDPRRVDDAMVAALQVDVPVFVALHTNHPREFTPEARRACAALVDAGVPMVSQTVLLAGVNDDPQVLASLMRTLVKNRIKPYYLHHGDLAQGTSHFRTTLERGQELVAGLRGHLSGLCQPTYVLDIPGGHGKVPAGPAWVELGPSGTATVRDIHGALHAYPPSPDGESAQPAAREAATECRGGPG